MNEGWCVRICVLSLAPRIAPLARGPVKIDVCMENVTGNVESCACLAKSLVSGLVPIKNASFCVETSAKGPNAMNLVRKCSNVVTSVVECVESLVIPRCVTFAILPSERSSLGMKMRLMLDM